MAKLPRTLQKIFGQNAPTNQFGKIGSFSKGSPERTKNVADMQELNEYLNGWFACVVGNNSPTIEDMNSMFYMLTQQIAYILQTGLPEWSSVTEYHAGSLVQDGAGVIYKSLQDFNENNPLTEEDWWAELETGGGGSAEFFDTLEYGDGETTDFYLGDGNSVESKNQLDVFVGGIRMTSNGYELNAAKDTVIFPYAIEGPVGDTPATSVYIRGIKSIPQELVGTSNVTLRSFTGSSGVASFDTGIDIQSPNQVIAFIGSAPQFGRISTSGSVVTFDNPPYDGAEINIVILGVVEIGKPSENTVGSNEIQNSAKNEMSPIGSVIAFAGAAAPNKYLICDGSEISRSTYSDLFSVLSTTYGSGDGSTTFNLPDLRGEFVRGLDGGRGVDSGRTLGSAQSDELASHRHSISSMRQRTAGGSFVNRWSVESGTHYTNYTGGDETRPRNIAMNYIIKAEY